MPEKVVVIGSGPAGWAACIYTSRANLEPLCFEGAISEENRLQGTLPLGQLALTTEVENYPGFPAGNLESYLDDSIDKSKRQYMAPHLGHGVSGPELMELMRQQSVNFGTKVVTDDVVDVDLSAHPFKITRANGETVEALSIIIATGARANYLGLESKTVIRTWVFLRVPSVMEPCLAFGIIPWWLSVVVTARWKKPIT